VFKLSTFSSARERPNFESCTPTVNDASIVPLFSADLTGDGRPYSALVKFLRSSFLN